MRARRRAERVLAALVLCVVLLTFGSQSIQFYAYWILGILTVGVGALLVVLNRRLSRALFLVALLMTMWTGVALLITPYVTDHQTHLTMIALVVFYSLFVTCLVACISKSIEEFGTAVVWCACVWVVVNTILLLAFSVGLKSYDGRAFSGVYYNRNTLAVVGVVLFLFLLFVARPVNRLARICLLTGLAGIVVATLSTKGAVGLMIVVVGYCGTQRRRSIGIAAIIGLVAVAVIVDGATSGRLTEKVSAITRTEDVGGPTVGASAYQRLWLILESARLIANHPLTGVGVHNSQFHLFTERYYLLLARGDIEPGTVGVYSHNNYTEMLLNAGVFAFILYYAPLVWLFKRTINTRVTRDNRRIRGLVLTGLVLKGFLDMGMVGYFEFSHLWLLASLWFLYVNKLWRSDSVAKGAVRNSDVFASAGENFSFGPAKPIPYERA